MGTLFLESRQKRACKCSTEILPPNLRKKLGWTALVGWHFPRAGTKGTEFLCGPKQQTISSFGEESQVQKRNKHKMLKRQRSVCLLKCPPPPRGAPDHPGFPERLHDPVVTAL